MNNLDSSIQSAASGHHDNSLQLLKSSLGETLEFTSRCRLGTAVSLASLMAVSTASAQEGGSSGLELPTIDVSGNAQSGYQTTQQSITRLQTPLLNTPQTVNVVPQKEIQERRLTTMEEALRTVPGITFSAGEGGQQGDSPIIRGFVARGDIFRDGFRDPGWYTRDLFDSTASRSTKALPLSPSDADRPAAPLTTSLNFRPAQLMSRAPLPGRP